MTSTWAILVAATIPSLCLVYVTLSQQRTFREERKRDSRAYERQIQVSREQSQMAMELIQASRSMAQEFVAATQGMHKADQATTQKMMEGVTSTISGIVSPPPQPPSQEAEALAQALTMPLWETDRDPRPAREREEVASNGAGPWVTKPINPFSDELLPDDVPGPLGESAQYPDDLSP